jgi:hypothetical protein
MVRSKSTGWTDGVGLAYDPRLLCQILTMFVLVRVYFLMMFIQPYALIFLMAS